MSFADSMTEIHSEILSPHPALTQPMRGGLGEKHFPPAGVGASGPAKVIEQLLSLGHPESKEISRELCVLYGGFPKNLKLYPSSDLQITPSLTQPIVGRPDRTRGERSRSPESLAQPMIGLRPRKEQSNNCYLYGFLNRKKPIGNSIHSIAFYRILDAANDHID